MYKIADFEFSKSQNNTETVIGTPIYMSPEIFQNSKYGFEVDGYIGRSNFRQFEDCILYLHLEKWHQKAYPDRINGWH